MKTGGSLTGHGVHCMQRGDVLQRKKAGKEKILKKENSKTTVRRRRRKKRGKKNLRSEFMKIQQMPNFEKDANVQDSTQDWWIQAPAQRPDYDRIAQWIRPSSSAAGPASRKEPEVT